LQQKFTKRKEKTSHHSPPSSPVSFSTLSSELSFSPLTSSPPSFISKSERSQQSLKSDSLTQEEEKLIHSRNASLNAGLVRLSNILQSYPQNNQHSQLVQVLSKQLSSGSTSPTMIENGNSIPVQFPTKFHHVNLQSPQQKEERFIFVQQEEHNKHEESEEKQQIQQLIEALKNTKQPYGIFNFSEIWSHNSQVQNVLQKQLDSSADLYILSVLSDVHYHNNKKSHY